MPEMKTTMFTPEEVDTIAHRLFEDEDDLSHNDTDELDHDAGLTVREAQLLLAHIEKIEGHLQRIYKHPDPMDTASEPHLERCLHGNSKAHLKIIAKAGKKDVHPNVEVTLPNHGFTVADSEHATCHAMVAINRQLAFVGSPVRLRPINLETREPQLVQFEK